MIEERIYFRKEEYVVLKKTKIIIHDFWITLTKGNSTNITVINKC
jgi:hypothetical protein